jgi:RNA polymerase sigma-70 factor, ECF subfamily
MAAVAAPPTVGTPSDRRKVVATSTPVVAPPSSSEEHLVARAQAGDSVAFDALAERYSTRLRRVLYRITRDCDAAYDAVQEALLRAWQNIGRFEGRSRFFTWLTRIGINEAYRGMRKASFEVLEIDDGVGRQVPGWGNLPDEVFESREFLAAIDRALGELPPDYRAAVVLRDVEGLSTREAAEALKIGERALKSRLHRGRMALRAELDSYFAEGGA